MSAVLLVRCGDDHLGLPVEGVEEVFVVGELLPAPVAREAVRGLVPVRGRLAPLVHLRALLDDAPPPGPPADAAVLVRSGGRLVALEIDEALDLLHEAARPVPQGWDLPWAAGVVPREDTLIPVVELDGLVERLLAGMNGDG